jgi:sarcosine oxidase subunit beta
MTMRTAVAVIGGGLIGCWTAFFLRRRGIEVVVIERGLVGAQSSGVNFGNIRLQGRHRNQYALALRSHALWEQAEALPPKAVSSNRPGICTSRSVPNRTRRYVSS